MNNRVTVTGKERSYLSRQSDNDSVGDKAFNAVLALKPNEVESKELRRLAYYIRGMNNSYKLMTQK